MYNTIIDEFMYSFSNDAKEGLYFISTLIFVLSLLWFLLIVFFMLRSKVHAYTVTCSRLITERDTEIEEKDWILKKYHALCKDLPE